MQVDEYVAHGRAAVGVRLKAPKAEWMDGEEI